MPVISVKTSVAKEETMVARLSWTQLAQLVAVEQKRPIPPPAIADYIIWNFTAFPLAGLSTVIAQLRTYFSTPEMWKFGDGEEYRQTKGLS